MRSTCSVGSSGSITIDSVGSGKRSKVRSSIGSSMGSGRELFDRSRTLLG